MESYLKKSLQKQLLYDRKETEKAQCAPWLIWKPYQMCRLSGIAGIGMDEIICHVD